MGRWQARCRRRRIRSAARRAALRPCATSSSRGCAEDADAEPLLVQTNSLLSELAAAEFPVAGFRRERIQKAREAYQRLFEYTTGQRV